VRFTLAHVFIAACHMPRPLLSLPRWAYCIAWPAAGKPPKVTPTDDAGMIPWLPDESQAASREEMSPSTRPSIQTRVRGTDLGGKSLAPARARTKYTQVKRLYRYGHFLGNTMKRSAATKVGDWVGVATKVVQFLAAVVHLLQQFS
jgi:hypothetical protein